MKLQLNIRHIEKASVRMEGALESTDLDLDDPDPLIHPQGGLRYEFEATRENGGILLRGRIAMDFRCECARCLSEFSIKVDLPDWTSLIPLEGDDRAEIKHDCVDLTPYLREDIVLALPQRPLCRPECEGIQGLPAGVSIKSAGDTPLRGSPSAWRELDGLKLIQD